MTEEEKLAKMLYERYTEPPEPYSGKMLSDVPIAKGVEYRTARGSQARIIDLIYDEVAIVELIEAANEEQKKDGYKWGWNIEYWHPRLNKCQVVYHPNDSKIIPFKDLPELEQHVWLEDARKFLEQL